MYSGDDLTKLRQNLNYYNIRIHVYTCVKTHVPKYSDTVHTVKREFHASVHQTKQAKMIMAIQCFRLSH